MPFTQTFRKIRRSYRLGVAAWKLDAPENKRVALVDAIGLELGSSFLRFCDDLAEGNLIGRITEMRNQLSVELDTVLPTVRVRDNFGLDEATYVISVLGLEVARGEAPSAEKIVSHLREVIRHHKAALLT